MLGCEGASFLSYVILLLTSVHGRDDSNKSLKLKIHSKPAGSVQDVPGFLKLTEGSTVNLTCEVADWSRDARDEVRLSWYLPNNFVQPQPRFEQIGGVWSSTLIISPVIESDTGDYECWARHKTTSGKEVKNILKVLIEPRRGNCQPGQYQCEGEDKQYCIASRYRCDSHMDCPAGDDESPVFCGPDPCKGKIVCPELDFRCIDPTEYCCDPQTEPETCKFMYPCCESVIEFSIRSRLAAQWAHHQGGTEGEEVRSDLAYLHSTVYTVIGCSVAFIVIVLGLGLAICRLHLLRKSQRSAVVRGGGRAHPPITLHDLDIYFSERSEVNPGNNDIQHIGITYNINHGVQIMGRGVGQPPPYSNSPRVRLRGPPPPYHSQENIAQPLLDTEDDNNNGDINGNSDMVDNNVRAPAEREERTGSPPPVYPGPGLGQSYSSSDTDTE